MIPDSASIPKVDAIFLADVCADPVKFTKFFFDGFLFSYQLEPILALKDNRRVVTTSGNATGKSKGAAYLAAWWLLTRHDSGVITTAPTQRQVETIIWKELAGIYETASRRALKLPGGTLIRPKDMWPPPSLKTWNIGKQWFARGVAAKSKESFQGSHPAGGMLVIVDESSGISNQIFEGIMAVTTGAEDRIFAIGNPTRASEWYYEAFKPDSGWKTFHINNEELPWIKKGIPAPYPALFSQAKLAEWLADCGGDKGDVRYRVHVLGQFPRQDENYLVMEHEVLLCEQENEEQPIVAGKPVIRAVDIARGGQNWTVATDLWGNLQTSINKMQKTPNLDMVDVADWVHRNYNEHKVDAVVIDCDGMGWTVYDILKRRNIPVLEFHGQTGKPREESVYCNVRAESYFLLGEDIKHRRLKLIPNQEQRMQLTWIKKDYHRTNNRLKIQSKEDMVRDGKRSPDHADALMMCRWGQRVRTRSKTWRPARLRAR